MSQTFTSSVQAVAFAPATSLSTHTEVLAVGLEDGSLFAFRLTFAGEQRGVEDVTWQKIWEASAAQRHCGAVNRLAWQRPKSDSWLLASAGHDRAVNIFRVAFEY